jgi:hypothetical protein
MNERYPNLKGMKPTQQEGPVSEAASGARNEGPACTVDYFS